MIIWYGILVCFVSFWCILVEVSSLTTNQSVCAQGTNFQYMHLAGYHCSVSAQGTFVQYLHTYPVFSICTGYQCLTCR